MATATLTRPAGRVRNAERIGPGANDATPWAASALSGMERVGLAALLRVSQEQLQDVRGSLLRQVDNIIRALPVGWFIVAWYIDIESGRMELDQRGGSTGHERVVLPVDRAGGLPELLDHAARPGCGFLAVIAENNERVARYAYFGTKVEHELGRCGMELFTAEEGINPQGSKATKVLTRRVKQAIAEWYALNVLELAWAGSKVHTTEGYNTGPVPYGYLAVKEPHPVPARRARGLTKTRLDIDPIAGPVVAQIFAWRAMDRLTLWQIAGRLNQDHHAYPPPQPLAKGAPRGAGRWLWTTVRNILDNPKYTGHMVWNRTTSRTGATLTRRRQRRANPVEQWVWSAEPTHPAMITLDRFRQVQAISDAKQGSRADTPSDHDHTGNSGGGDRPHAAAGGGYRLRGLVTCGHCGRRMVGDRRDGRIYYRCDGPRDNARHVTRPDHPRSLYIREEALLPAVASLIAVRVFGSDRHTHLQAQHEARPRALAEQHAATIEATRQALDEITTRQDRLMAELEDTPQEDKSYRERIRARYRQLDAERLQTETTLRDLKGSIPTITVEHPGLLDSMPQAALDLASLPERIQRRLFDALCLSIRVDSGQSAHVSVTVTGDTPDIIGPMIAASHSDQTATTDPKRGDALQTGIATVSHHDRLRAGLVRPLGIPVGGPDG